MRIQEIRDVMLIVVLLCAAWQDWNRRSISLSFLLSVGCIGGLFAFVLERSYDQILLSCGIGFLILGLGKWTGGGIGDGDGWFFVVLGLYLEWRDNLVLFLSGIFLCFWVSLFLVVRNCWRREKKRMALPFLLFLLPGGIGMTVARSFLV